MSAITSTTPAVQPQGAVNIVTDYRYTVQYLDENPEETIDYNDAVDRLSNCYNNIEATMNVLRSGVPVRTPFAVYRACPVQKVPA